MLLANMFSENGLIAIVIVAVLIFGGTAIPKLARSLGTAKSEFEKGLKSVKTEETAKATDAAEPTAPEAGQ